MGSIDDTLCYTVTARLKFYAINDGLCIGAKTRAGSYIKVHLVGSDYLALSEVEVRGHDTPTCTNWNNIGIIANKNKKNKWNNCDSGWALKTTDPGCGQANIAGCNNAKCCSEILTLSEATQTSTYRNIYDHKTNFTDYMGPQNAYDGNRNGKLAHTASGTDLYWRANLPNGKTIDGIDIWNKQDGYEWRLVGARVSIDDTLCYTVTARLKFYAINHGLCIGAKTRAGSYIKVHLVGSDYLALSEVEVRGHDTPTCTNWNNIGIIANKNKKNKWNNCDSGWALKTTDPGCGQANIAGCNNAKCCSEI